MVPVAVTTDVTAARDAAHTHYAGYGTLPSYRATLDRGGAGGLGDVAIIGTDEQVETQLRAFAAAGVTDVSAATFPAPGGSIEGTYELLASLTKAGSL
jgi:alkanesulfonate monooxygenase SsuD/methylene tetrahydromethanopterin reductase-like flavin-dependent oxidoreductase (luciferase family)